MEVPRILGIRQRLHGLPLGLKRTSSETATKIFQRQDVLNANILRKPYVSPNKPEHLPTYPPLNWTVVFTGLDPKPVSGFHRPKP